MATVEKPRTEKQPITRLALSKTEAAEAIGLLRGLPRGLRLARPQDRPSRPALLCRRHRAPTLVGAGGEPNDRLENKQRTEPKPRPPTLRTESPSVAMVTPASTGSHGRPTTGRSSVRGSGIAIPEREAPSQSAQKRRQAGPKLRERLRGKAAPGRVRGPEPMAVPSTVTADGTTAQLLPQQGAVRLGPRSRSGSGSERGQELLPLT